MYVLKLKSIRVIAILPTWIKRLRQLANNYVEAVNKLISDLLRKQLIKIVAVLNPEGLLATYQIIESKEYFTLELDEGM
ncbi:hypothetical protein [Clostridium oryzae]|uniref:Uncharacterized protein n=1 Tax=Clostridium oryzae TaxID=1450648 RepID=A0A1V4I9K3_9CLOT|nr:hypothetical protein [Clostridium oryzae]OPJ56564.1 hypothetical protein CLORY_42770 [Clostridium oryzae]